MIFYCLDLIFSLHKMCFPVYCKQLRPEFLLLLGPFIPLSSAVSPDQEFYQSFSSSPKSSFWSIPFWWQKPTWLPAVGTCCRLSAFITFQQFQGSFFISFRKWSLIDQLTPGRHQTPHRRLQRDSQDWEEHLEAGGSKERDVTCIYRSIVASGWFISSSGSTQLC